MTMNFGATKTRLLSVVLAGIAMMGPAFAHDFWVQPSTYHAPEGRPIPFTIQVGHGGDRQRWAGRLERVVRLQSIGPDRVVIDRKSALQLGGPASDGALAFMAPGTHMLVFESTHASSELPALRFNDYLKAEGLTPALEHRARNGATNQAGREIYSRRSKAIVQIAGAARRTQSPATVPVGLTLEIVPERDPYALSAGESLPIRVFYEGNPLAGALVKLTSLEFDAAPIESHLTDVTGRAIFRPPLVGAWLLNVIWTKSIDGNPDADFDTTFSSLTFGYASVNKPR